MVPQAGHRTAPIGRHGRRRSSPVWPGHDNNFRAGLASPARHGHQLGQWLVDMLTIAVEQDIDRRPPAGTASRQSIRNEVTTDPHDGRLL